LALGQYGPSRTLDLTFVLDARGLADNLSNDKIGSVGSFLECCSLFFMLLRVLLRRQWLAAAVFILIPAAGAFGNAHPGIEALGEFSFFALFAATLLRFGGLLPTIVCLFVGNTLGGFAIADFAAWYASTTVLVLVVFLALTAYAFHTAVAGRPLFKGGFLEPD
jgi:hypothetical protein